LGCVVGMLRSIFGADLFRLVDFGMVNFERLVPVNGGIVMARMGGVGFFVLGCGSLPMFLCCVLFWVFFCLLFE